VPYIEFKGISITVIPMDPSSFRRSERPACSAELNAFLTLERNSEHP